SRTSSSSRSGTGAPATRNAAAPRATPPRTRRGGTMTTESMDLREATDAFAGRALTDLAGMMTTLMCVAGDRLGLFARLAEGPATSAELAERAGVDERYAREWLRGMTAAGYLTYDREGGRHALPAAHVPVLADEGGPMFMGGVYQEAAGA